jgi:hypothetical protein
MGAWTNWEKEIQLNKLRFHNGEIHRTSFIRKLFGIQLTVNFKDLWLYKKGHLEKVKHGWWRISENEKGGI